MEWKRLIKGFTKVLFFRYSTLIKVKFSFQELFDQPLVVLEGDSDLNRGGGLGTDVFPSSSASNGSLARRKRATSAGAGVEDSMFKLTEVASQTIAADQAEFGDSWTFELVIDLPQLDQTDMTDIKIELFGLDPEYGWHGAVAGCTIHVKSDFRCVRVPPVPGAPRGARQPDNGHSDRPGVRDATVRRVSYPNREGGGNPGKRPHGQPGVERRG